MIKPGMYISDRYEIIEKIGSGGMADVYKAKCHRLNRYVAIKILKQEFSGDKNFITKFRGEAQSAAGLSHPNIVSVYDVGDDEGLHYIVMELVEGITLKKFIEKKGRLDIKEAVGITIQIAQGMEAAHNNNIIHRDIKPQNIIISREGKVKVADFGIARAVSANTYTQNAIGSVHYLSPEQARGGYSDEKSDIYSLGVTLYEMLSGTLPFAGDNTVSVALLHIQSEARPVRELIPSVPYSLDRIVQKCMQKRPENRYLHASELILDLKRSITNPDGDFVKLPLNGFVPDNPTRKFTEDEVTEIKSSAAKSGVTHYEGRKQGRQVLKEEEEELDSINSNWEKVIIVLSIIVAIGLTIGIIYLAGRFFGISELLNPNKTTPSPSPTTMVQEGPSLTPTTMPVQTIPMPNVDGYTFEDAEKLLHGKSPAFIVLEAGTEWSDKPKGTVIRQYPTADSDVLMNATIRLTISAGPEPIEMPFVAGLSQEDATRQLTAMGLEVIPSYEYNDETERGNVVGTIPGVMEMVFPGDKVTLIVSNGRNIVYVEMINLVGMTLAEAEAALAEKGLILGEVTEGDSDAESIGKVINQSVKLEQTIVSGTAVNLIIGRGPGEGTPVPTPTPETVLPPDPTEAPSGVPTPTPEATMPTTAPTTPPTPTPTPTEAPTVGTTEYWTVFLVTAGKPKPVEVGQTVDYIIEVDQGNGIWYSVVDSTISYDEYPETGFYLKLKKEDYPGLTVGTVDAYLYVGTADSDPTMRDVWTVNLQELVE